MYVGAVHVQEGESKTLVKFLKSQIYRYVIYLISCDLTFEKFSELSSELTSEKFFKLASENILCFGEILKVNTELASQKSDLSKVSSLLTLKHHVPERS